MDSGAISATTATIATKYDDCCGHTPQDDHEIPETANKKIVAAVGSITKATNDITKLADSLKTLKQDEQSKLLLQEVKEVLKIGLLSPLQGNLSIVRGPL